MVINVLCFISEGALLVFPETVREFKEEYIIPLTEIHGVDEYRVTFCDSAMLSFEYHKHHKHHNN